MSINILSILKTLCIIFAVIVFGHAISVGLNLDLLEPPTLGKNVFFDLFYFEYEKNFTALFSGGLFIILSMFFHAIGKNNVASQKQWNFLKYVAIYLGCDEWFAIHDTIWNVKGFFLGIQFWIWIYLIGFLILLLPLLSFIKKMDPTLRKHLFISGFVFILGAGVFETLNPHSGFNTLVYQIYLILEDGFEMLGVIIAIWGCITFLKKHNVTQLNFLKVPTIIVLAIGSLDLIISYIVNT